MKKIRRDTVIQVQITKTRNKLSSISSTVEISVRGHAMSAPYGQDIVCAAVSVLFTAVANHLSSPVVDFIGDESLISADDVNPADKRLLTMFEDTVKEIAEQYPDNVHLLIQDNIPPLFQGDYHGRQGQA